MTADPRRLLETYLGDMAARRGTGAARPETTYSLFGETTLDVYLNDSAYWSNIPVRVWRYRLGGYQVVKKWLSYRERPVLGRPLRDEEVLYVQEMARRIAAILLMGPALDANYAAAKADPYPWPKGERPA